MFIGWGWGHVRAPTARRSSMNVSQDGSCKKCYIFVTSETGIKKKIQTVSVFQLQRHVMPQTPPACAHLVIFNRNVFSYFYDYLFEHREPIPSVEITQSAARHYVLQYLLYCSHDTRVYYKHKSLRT